ncbi:MAG: hypothetical protein PUD55_01625 [Firmicutes bacterium]|nr:hypothetical protein [Bacillota bacterium]
MNFNQRCVYIRDKKPQIVSEAMISPRAIILKGPKSVLDHGVINVADGIYACMYSDDIRYISIVTAGSDSRVLTLYCDAQSDYESLLDTIRSSCSSLTISSQNNKLNSYANSVAEKLRIGVELRIVDAKDDDDSVICPGCGVANDWNPNMPYCMECGAALNHE